MEENKPHKTELSELKDLYLFEELFQLVGKSPGLAIAFSYLILLLSSLSYLHIVYSSLDVNIMQFVALEDILVTPVKKPDIIISFFLLFCIFCSADIGNRYRARIAEKYAEGEIPLRIKIIQGIFMAPKKRKANIRAMFFIMAFSLVVYVFAFATSEAKNIKEGQGLLVEIAFADDQEALQTTLLGTTTNYVITFNHLTGESFAYYVEAIKSIKKIKPTPENPKQSASEKSDEVASEKAPTTKPR